MPILVEAGWGGLVQAPSSITWTDITRRVDMVQGVTITRGASDEKSETQPGSATMTLDNSDGWLTPGNPNSGYAPYVRKNAPLRVSMAVIPTRSGAAPYSLSMLGDAFDDDTPAPMWTASGGARETRGRMRLPLAPGVTGSYSTAREWKLTESALTAKLSTVPAAGGGSSVSLSMYIHAVTSGTRLRWYYSAVNNQLRALSEVGGSDASPTTLTYSPIDHAWLRIREAGGTLYFESSPDGWDWAVQRSLPTPAWVTSDTVQVEFAAFRNTGTTDYAEWDLIGARVRPRFYGMVNEFPVSWSGMTSSVSISATDLFKRLNRLPALRSMLGMEVLTVDTLTGRYSFPAVYFPLAEPSGSAAAGDVVGHGSSALAVTQVGSGGSVTFGDEGVPETGETAPAFAPASATAGQYLVGDLGPQTAADSTTSLEHIQVWVKTSTAGRAIVGLHDLALDNQLILSLNGSGVLQVESTQDGSALTVGTTTSANLADGVWHHIVYDGSAKRVYVDGVSVSGTLPATSTQDARVLYIGGYRGGRLWSGQIAHMSLHLTNGPCGATYAASYGALTGFSGEAADARVERLARYAGISSVTVFGATHDPIATQGPAGSGVVARLREVEATESGRLYAERDFYGLAYQSRDVRFNPDTVGEVFAIAYADLEPGLQLADDDQKLCNEIEASRPGGATQLVNAPSSIEAYGTYPQQLSVLKTSDSAVTDAAHWTVQRYADPEAEIREVPIEAHSMPDYLDILDAEISSYFSVYDLPEQAPAPELRVTVEGYTETIREQSHEIRFRTSTTTQDSVWVIGDPIYGQLGITSRLSY